MLVLPLAIFLNQFDAEFHKIKESGSYIVPSHVSPIWAIWRCGMTIMTANISISVPNFIKIKEKIRAKPTYPFIYSRRAVSDERITVDTFQSRRAATTT
jgi:hypothetical protein